MIARCRLGPVLGKKLMSFIQRELRRIATEMQKVQDQEQYRQLYAAQQALSWAIDPDQFRQPYETIMGIQEGLKDCSVVWHLPLS